MTPTPERATPRDLDLLRHMLGINKPWLRDPEPYRNYFDAGEADQPDLGRAERVQVFESLDEYRLGDNATEKKVALAKLTDRERKLLGLP